ncbi:MAG: helix-turn-helix domain-containing protein [Treponema sp.]|nr:helix-turn-helix domain-containing protein [Treponema sp.]
MKTIFTLMTEQELSVVLNISEKTVIKLAETGELPSLPLGNRIYFRFDEILKHFRELEGRAA